MSTTQNLGRVRGASSYYSSATSATSIAQSSLTPAIAPLAGDTVLFPNGDVRVVASISNGTVTCGSVVTNLKGAKGDNGDKGDTGEGANPNLLINSNFFINQRAGYYAPAGIDVYPTAMTDNPIAKLATTTQTLVESNTVRKASGCTVKETFTSTSHTLWQYPTPNQKSSITLYANGTVVTSFDYDTSSKTISAIMPFGAVYEVVYTASTNGTTPTEAYFKTSDCIGGYTISNKYTVDRWILYTSGNSTVKAEYGGGITVTSGGNNTDIAQLLENGALFLGGKTVTLSVNTTIGGSTATTAKTTTLSSAGTSASANLPSSAGQIFVEWTSGGVYKVWLRVYANKTVRFNWAKLEINSAATPYSPPVPAEEFPKCQRFYQRISNKEGSPNIAGGIATGSIVYFVIPLRMSLRAYPTYESSRIDIYAGVAGGSIAITASSITSITEQRDIVTLSTSASTTQGNYYHLRIRYAGSYIAFDAELY